MVGPIHHGCMSFHTKQKKIICFGFLPGVLCWWAAQFQLCSVTHLKEYNPAQQSHTIPYHIGKVFPADVLSVESSATVSSLPDHLAFAHLWFSCSLFGYQFYYVTFPVKVQTNVCSSQIGHQQTKGTVLVNASSVNPYVTEVPYCTWVRDHLGVADSKAAASLKILAQEGRQLRSWNLLENCQTAWPLGVSPPQQLLAAFVTSGVGFVTLVLFMLLHLEGVL